jgi:MFS family permease
VSASAYTPPQTEEPDERRLRRLRRVFLGAGSRDASLIAANILVDAIGSAIYYTGIAFYAIRFLHVDPKIVALAFSIGGIGGLLLTYPAGNLADRFAPRSLLLILQPIQAAIFVVMVLVPKPSVFAVTVAIGMICARVQSPIRGSLQPRYVPRAEMVKFKAALRNRTMLVVLSGSGIAAAIASTMPVRLLWLIPASNAVSYAAAWWLTRSLPITEQPAAKSDTAKLSRFRPSPTLLTTILGLGVLSFAGVIVEMGMPLWIAASPERAPAYLVAIVSIVNVVSSIAMQSTLVRPLERPRNLATGMFLAGASGVAGLVLFWQALSNDGVTAAVLVVCAVVPLSATYVLTVLAIWSLQYSVGDESARGRVVGLFTLVSGLADAVGPAVAAQVIFGAKAAWLVLGAGFAAAGAVVLWCVRRLHQRGEFVPPE